MERTTTPAAEDMAALPSLEEVERARARIARIVRRTPLHHSHWLSARAGVEVHLKLECWQATHSFKLRGAANALATLGPADRRRGIVTASAGNHGLALAHAARLEGVRATIFVPVDAPESKRARIQREGADLREVDGGYDGAAAQARSHAAETGAYLLHAFADPAVVAGQGTVALEVLEDLPSAREIIVPVGGGGLIAGVGAALAGRGEEIRLLGIQSRATRAMHAAFAAGRAVPVPDAPTLCDGLAGETEQPAYERARSVVDTIHLVAEEAVAPAIAALFREEGIVAEGSGVVGVAGVLAGTFPLAGPTVVVISGGNIDGRTLARILESS